MSVMILSITKKIKLTDLLLDTFYYNERSQPTIENLPSSSCGPSQRRTHFVSSVPNLIHPLITLEDAVAGIPKFELLHALDAQRPERPGRSLTVLFLQQVPSF
jgi:hypothetical protein